MKLSESITKYERITGEGFEIPDDHTIKIMPTGEFMVWKLGVHDSIPFFFINQTYAKSFSAFVPFIKEVCKAAGIETIVTATTRNPRAHIKKWKMERLPEFDYEHEGRSYFMLKGHISNLK